LLNHCFWVQEKAEREFYERQEAMKRADEERVAKNREKRLKKKSKKKGKSKSTASTATNGSTNKNKKDDESSSSDSSDDEGGARKKLKLRSGAPGVVFRGADEREQDDDQPREEEIKVKRIEEALNHPEPSSEATSQPQGLVIVDED
jgi:hypothetical protein